MWTRTYLFLLGLRLYFALSPSYIHPDENFQGPEVIAGKTLGFPNHLTWEFTSDKPVRSVFPLWLVYGVAMKVMQWIWAEIGTDDIAAGVVYYTLRGLMFVLSFVLEDWALHELVQSPRHRRLAIVLVASSYITWTYQTHTFSNSVETLVVLWSLVMIQRVREKKLHDPLLSPTILGILLTFGIFNRVTFPAFTLVPCLLLVPHMFRQRLTFIVFIAAILVTGLIALAQDTFFYRPTSTYRDLFTNPVITPLNSLRYNSNRSNLEQHGLHPRYQHILINLPQLLGPAILLLRSIDTLAMPLNLLSAVSGILILSVIPHQEARFLMPTIPLIISSIHLPRSQKHSRYWLATWIIFNAIFGVLMGIFHQGGVIPAQIWIAHNHQNLMTASSSSAPPVVTKSQSITNETLTVLWWRTYPPPIWLLDHSPVKSVSLMGLPLSDLQDHIFTSLDTQSTVKGTCDPSSSIALIAPFSSLDLERWREESTSSSSKSSLIWQEKWRRRRHLNLDDLDFGTEDRGVVGEVKRIFGKTGLGIWSVGRNCTLERGAGRGGFAGIGGDW